MIALALLALQLASSGPSAPHVTLFDAGRDNQLGLTFSPDGNTAWWTAWNGKWGGEVTEPRTIYTSQWADHAWSTPAPAPFTGEFDDDDPFVSPAGEWLYFVSTRPADADGAETQATSGVTVCASQTGSSGCR